jgi:RNA polymerase sigma-70 factor (ECF subfamily)
MDGVWQQAHPEPATVEAIEHVYEHGYRRFLRLAEAIVRDAELARDIVQDSFARAIRGRCDYRGDGSVEGWLWRIVVNTAKNALRDRPSSTVPLEDATYEPSSNGHAHHDDVRVVLAALPERQRLVLFLRYYADLDYVQIAAALQIQPGTVGATLNQAHAALRRTLEEVPQ